MDSWSEEQWSRWLEEYSEAWQTGQWMANQCHADVQFWTPWGNWSTWREVWEQWGEWNHNIQHFHIRSWSHKEKDVLIFWEIEWNDSAQSSWGSDWITVDSNHRIFRLRQTIDPSSWPIPYQAKNLNAA